MTPMATTDGINAGWDVIAPIVLVAMLIVLVAILVRRLLMAAADELGELGRTYGPLAAKAALDRRPNLSTTPWFCSRCTSRNGVAARVCYKCGAERDTSELVVDGAEEPAGPSAGLAQRNRSGG